MKSIMIALMFFGVTLMAQTLGSVKALGGIVKVTHEGSIKKEKIKQGYEVQEGDLISTNKKGFAQIVLSDNSTIVLDKSSAVTFGSAQEIAQAGGKVLYKITSRDAKNSLKVKTPFAIIGIKGTTFIVKSDKDDEGVLLKEGLVGVASIKEEFALYRKEVMAQFNNFKDTQMSEFEKFKNGMEEPKPEITKEFDLAAGNSISFDGSKVEESGWNEKDDQEFAAFEAMIDKELEEFKETQE
jgi:hypothetical protein